MRRAQLLAQAAAGQPNKFMTLTVNPALGASPEERRGMLANAFKLLVKRLRDRPEWRDLQYFTVVEKTLAGEPHLHILLRAKYIPQPLIAAIMDELIGAPVVDIRKIKGVREAVRYVAKYVSKAPATFGTFKRYWQSRDWQLETGEEPEPHPSRGPGWQVLRESMSFVRDRWMHEGWAGRPDGDNLWRFVPGRYYGRAPPLAGEKLS